MVPAMLTGVGAARYLPQAALRHPFLTAPATGAAAGGIYGGAQAPTLDPEQIASEAARGAGIGALAGPAGQAIGAGAGHVIAPLARTFMGRGTPQRAATVLQRDVVEPTGMLPQEIAREMAERGPGTMPLEVTGEAGMLAAMRAVQAAPAARQKLRTAVDKRLAGKWPRLKSDVKRLMGKGGEKFQKSLDDAVARRRAEAKPYYQQAFKETVDPANVAELQTIWNSYIDEGIPEINFAALSGSPRLASLAKKQLRL